MLSEKMVQALNDQVRDELYSEYYYLAMSAWCEEHDLPGMAAFMALKSSEERTHAMKIYHYILDRGGRVVLQEIARPPADYKSYLDIFQSMLEHEKLVTSLIHNLYSLALEEKDYATQVMLQWFIEEQVEEEKEATELIQQCRMIGDSESALFLFDQKLGQATPGAAEAAK